MLAIDSYATWKALFLSYFTESYLPPRIFVSIFTFVVPLAVMPDCGTNPAVGLFFARFEYIGDSSTPRQSGITASG